MKEFLLHKNALRAENAGATYQRLVDTIFEGQIGRNLETYVDDMVIKIKTEIEEGKFLGYIVTSEGIRANPKKIKAVMNMPSPKSTEEAFQAMKISMVELPTLTAPMKDEELIVHLSAADEAVSVVFLVERNGKQMPIHYAVELGAYDISYAPRSAIKGQVLADFLANTVAGDNQVHEKVHDSKEAPESSKARETLTNLDPMPEAEAWKFYTDEASNDYGSGAGLIFIDPEGTEYSYALRFNFVNSNNDADYEALLSGLRIAT
ncbi:reverse transcriptase domain-containing protein [Tanacetum coccineum]